MKSYKPLSLCCAFLIPLPLAITSLTGVFGGIMGIWFPAWVLAGVLTMLLGHCFGLIIKKSSEKRIALARLSAVLTGIICAVLSVAAVYLLGMNSFAYVFIPAAVILWYRFGYRNGLERVLLTNSALGGFCVEAAFLFPLCDAVSRDTEEGTADESGAAAIMIVSALVLVLGALAVNRQRLAELSSRRSDKTAVLSKETVRFNTRLVLLFSAIMIVPFFFSRWGAAWLGGILKAVIEFLLNLFKLRSEDGSPNLPEYIGGGMIEAEAERPWLVIIFSIVTAAVLILAIKPMIKAMKALIKFITGRLGDTSSLKNADAAYIDFYESGASERSKTKKSGFKQAYRDFAKEKDGVRKYRLGYKAFMLALKEKGEEIRPSDTVSAHRRAAETLDRDLTDTVADKYERLRYRDEGADAADCAAMDKLLKNAGKKRGIRVLAERDSKDSLLK